ncbi:hypothetical protein BCR32DRAFT_271893 [Anaeromyces robustus]|uniref:HSF-type DNA-binding domain-containing protein n=1 Tax=Anaeromyces robustus TaxID=1754192 RepID=A0A1Y1WPI5_9FUNG|nr:hypothetical protein BCR32DRAFT_271893 [Anaeromyces robustus]|eukprot:ORX75457.1 hypothetical protein BCR32DRAFT_271893 [Anaeromyces robustus]
MQYMSSKSYPNEQEFSNRNSVSDYGSMQNNMNNNMRNNSNSVNNYSNNSDSNISNSINMNMNSNVSDNMNNMNSNMSSNMSSNMNNNINNNMNNNMGNNMNSSMNNNMNNNMNNMNMNNMNMNGNMNNVNMSSSMNNVNMNNSMSNINDGKYSEYSQNGVSVKKEMNSNHDNNVNVKFQDFQKQNFIGKLIEMLNNPEISDLISWHEDNVSVIIKNINEFSGRALPMYFKHNKFNSFTRQLNTYGFSYKKIDDQTFKFQNENFVKNKPELLKYISKKKNKSDEDIQSLQIELNDLKLSHGQLQREYNSLRQLMERMRIENNELRMMNSKLQNQIDDLQKLNNDIDLKYNSMKVNNGKIYYNLISILENLKVNDNQDRDYGSDIQSINSELYDADGSLVYNKRRCTSESTRSGSFTQNSMGDSTMSQNDNYGMGNSSHYSVKNMNSRIDSPRNQSLNNKMNNGSFNNSPRDVISKNDNYHHFPNNNQRTHSLNNPLNNPNQSQGHSQPQHHSESPNLKHTRRTSSLGMMKEKRNSIGYAASPVINKYSSQGNNRSSQNIKKVHRLSRSSNSSYLNSPNSLEMDTEQMNHPITESTNQNFLSPNDVIDNQLNGNLERNTPSLSSAPNSMYSNNYMNQPPSRSFKTESIRSAPSVMSNGSNFTLSAISNDTNSQRSFTIKSANSSGDETLINRNNTYPLNKHILEENEPVDPTKKK